MRRVAIAPIIGVLLAALTSTIGASGVSGAYTCSSSSSCLSANQSAPAGATGAAIKGAATNSYGVRGVSTSSAGTIGQSGAGSMLYPGVEGESTKNNGSDVAGGFGLTGISGTAPEYGVYALGQANGVYAQTTSLGTKKTTSARTGAIVASDPSEGDNYGGGTYESYNAGLVASSQNGAAVVARLGGGSFQSDTEAYPNGAALVVENNNPNSTSVLIDSTTTSSYGVDVENTNDSLTLLAPGYFMEASANNASTPFYVDTNGHMFVHSIETDKSNYARTRGASGAQVMAYGARTTAPSMEDAGEAQLVSGSATVKIDAALADVIDHRRSYLVFVTPEGDCKGLYVSAKTPSYFTIRELQGGRSTLAFQYRILAKPVDDDSRRLASLPPRSTETRRSFSSLQTAHRDPSTQSLSPLEQLQKRLGRDGYAKALREFVRQQNAR